MKSINCLYVIIVVLILCSCTGANMKKSIDAYSGDGEITYLESPGPFVPDGCEIALPVEQIDRDFEKEYNISLIPKGEYFFFVRVSEAVTTKNISEISFDATVKNMNTNTNLMSASSSINKMYKSPAEGFYRYHYGENSYFVVGKDNKQIVLSVKVRNVNNQEKFSFQALVIQGGGK